MMLLITSDMKPPPFSLSPDRASRTDPLLASEVAALNSNRDHTVTHRGSGAGTRFCHSTVSDQRYIGWYKLLCAHSGLRRDGLAAASLGGITYW